LLSLFQTFSFFHQVFLQTKNQNVFTKSTRVLNAKCLSNRAAVLQADVNPVGAVSVGHRDLDNGGAIANVGLPLGLALADELDGAEVDRDVVPEDNRVLLAHNVGHVAVFVPGRLDGETAREADGRVLGSKFGRLL
jgi:hypothetical protein